MNSLSQKELLFIPHMDGSMCIVYGHWTWTSSVVCYSLNPLSLQWLAVDFATSVSH